MDELKVGVEVSHFRLTQRLGQGAMGMVFKARDLTLGRDVALKFLELGAFPEKLHAELTRRFGQEAKLLARLSHPGLVEVYEADLTHGRPFFAMEFLPGSSLETELRHGLPTPAAVAGIGCQVCDVLAYAWNEHHVIHRDLKPGNLVRVGPDRIKVVDLGIAKVVDKGSTVSRFTTRSGIALGSLGYMSPEQHIVTGDKLDHRADIFALGVILVEMLTGRRVFEAPSLIILVDRKREGLPFKLAEAAPGIPAEVVSLLEAMTAPAVEDRPADYAAIRAGLAGLAAADHPDRSPRRPPADSGRTVRLLAKNRSGTNAPKPTVRIAPEPTKPTIRLDLDADVPIVRAKHPRVEIVPGAQVGEYTLGSHLGSGPHGTVFRARRGQDGQASVAIKFLEPDRCNISRERLAAHAHCLQRLDHRTISGLLGADWFGDHPYLVHRLHLVPEGRSFDLAAYIEAFGDLEGYLPESAVRHMGLLLLEALGHAHHHCVCHGNLKPSNVLFECVGIADDCWRLHMKLIDFGLAPFCRYPAADNVWQPPESVDAPVVTPTGDVWGVAALLYYALTRHHADSDRRYPSIFRPGIHEGWDAILGKALRADPARRFATTEEMADYVDRLDF